MGKEKKLATCMKHVPQNQLSVWFLASKNFIGKSVFECDKTVNIDFFILILQT